MKKRIQPEDIMSQHILDFIDHYVHHILHFLLIALEYITITVYHLPHRYARTSALLCCNSSTQIYLIFSVSMQRLANTKAHTSRFISANLPCNKFKNRLVNIMPYESTRVCLQPIRGVEGSDYINASFIDGYRYVLTLTSYPSGSKYRSFILQENGLELQQCACNYVSSKPFRMKCYFWLVINVSLQATESLYCHTGTTGGDHRGLLENALGAQLYHCCNADQA